MSVLSISEIIDKANILSNKPNHEILDAWSKLKEIYKASELILIAKLAELYRRTKSKEYTRDEAVTMQTEILEGAEHEPKI